MYYYITAVLTFLNAISMYGKGREGRKEGRGERGGGLFLEDVPVESCLSPSEEALLYPECGQYLGVRCFG